MATALVWFTTDLRLEDNETLSKALSQYDEIVPVYCYNEAHFGITDFGFQKTGLYRARFLQESLIDLNEQLNKIGSGLWVVKGQPAKALCDLVKKYHIKKVFTKREIAWEEIQTQNQVEYVLQDLGCAFETVDTSTLFHREDLPFAVSNIPDVFTEFRKNVEKKSLVREVIPQPRSIQSPPLEPFVLPTLTSLGLEEMPLDERTAFPFKGGASAGWERMNDYFFVTHAVKSYKLTRNEMVGSEYSTKFSAWLAMGCLSPKSIYHELVRYEKDYGANDSTYWVVFELLWRDYFRWMMEKYGHRFFLPSGIKKYQTPAGTHDVSLFELWVEGKTDNDFVNANMRELKLTGFMSNRGRQNVASYLCNDLQLDWRFGAAYFEQQLIDYDVSSNWCNWAYVAGVGNDPRSKRIFNVEKQANDYDQHKIFRNLWLTNK